MDLNDMKTGITRDELMTRIDTARRVMRENDLSVMIIVKRTLEGYDSWFTGNMRTETPWHINGGIVILPEGPVQMTTVRRSYLTDLIDDELRKERVKKGDDLLVTCHGYDYMDMVPYVTPEHNRIGVVHLSQIRADLHQYLMEHFPYAELVDVTLKMAEAKAVKSKALIDDMYVAADLVDKLMIMARSEIRVGSLEKDIASDIRYRASLMGSSGQLRRQQQIVRLTSAQQGRPSVKDLIFPGRALEYGDRINLCLQFISYRNTFGSLGRCFTLGKATDETRHGWDTAVGATNLIIEQLRPGIDFIGALHDANEFISKNGFEEDMTTWAYGVGYVLGEQPYSFTNGALAPLKEGMTLVIAPKVRHEGEDPFCCMETVLITKDGAKRMSTLSQDLLEIYV